MSQFPQIKIAATYMRGGTSKGVFFRLDDLPDSCQVPGAARDQLFMRVIGSPDPYTAQIDGMGGATSSDQQVRDSFEKQPAGSRCRLPLRSGVDRQGLCRLEWQLRQPVDWRRGFCHSCRVG